MKKIVAVALVMLALGFAAPAWAQVPPLDTQPIQGRNTTTHAKCTVGVDDTCTASPGIGGGGGAITAAPGSFATGFSPDLGKIGDLACSTDNGVACDLIQLVMRTNQRTTAMIAAIGTPMQATGGTVGLVAGSAYVGKFSAVDSGGADATDTTSHASKIIPMKPGTTTEIDLSNQSIWGCDGATAVSAANPLCTQDSASGATGAAPPAKGMYQATQQSGVLKGVTGCDLHAFYDASDNGKKTVVTGVANKKIYICGYKQMTGGTATNLDLGSGTGSDCVTTYTKIIPTAQLVANDRDGVLAGFWTGLVTLANGDNLCGNASAGNAHQWEIFYTVQP